MGIRDQSVQENIDRTPWWLVGAGIGGTTALFASGYLLLSSYVPGSGIEASPREPVTFLTCLYFSVVTETTLGDGSLSPHGLARLLVSLRVFFGLLVAGIIVAKIVSGPSSAVARLSSMIEGDWADFVINNETGARIIGRSWFQSERTGILYRGMDHLIDGTRADSFIAHSIAVSGNRASFTYQTFDYASKAALAGGVLTLIFDHIDGGCYTTYSITIADTVGNTFAGRGLRLSENQLEEASWARDGCTESTIKAVPAMLASHPKLNQAVVRTT